ncbi:MAG: hypothetical protein HY259_05010 [Chloroflexi bacterium]|nr:hypothetical protein [Chloroflexota bacterium]
MQMILVSCLLAATMLFVVLTIALRLLPTTATSLNGLLRGVLVLSVRFYYLILGHLAPVIAQRFRVNIVEGLWRLAACILVSQLLGSLLLLLAGWEVSGWTVVLFTLHGMIVGLVWDEVVSRDGLQLGLHL